MTIEEKISRLQAAAMEEARAEGNAIIIQHEEALEGVFEQHRKEVVRQVQTRVHAEEVNARQQLNMAMSKAQLELKRELGRTQQKLKTQLFEEVGKLLEEYMKTEAYTHLLVEYIEQAARYADGEAMTIYINPTDEEKKEYLEEHTGMQLTVSKEDFIGGVRAVIQERNILIDRAFKGALEEEQRSFVFKGGAGVE